MHTTYSNLIVFMYLITNMNFFENTKNVGLFEKNIFKAQTQKNRHTVISAISICMAYIS